MNRSRIGIKVEIRALVTLWMLLFLIARAAWAGRIIYVDADSPSGADGSSWAAAFKYLQDALVVADANDEIRLAEGTYTPDQSSLNPAGSGDREASFEIVTKVAIYGGYAGYGATDPNHRDIRAYETILSGDLDGNDVAPPWPGYLANERTRRDNCYHVVIAEAIEMVVLDGLTITAGHADDLEYPGNSGGGIHNHRGNIKVVDCTFRANYALSAGGGIYNDHMCSSIVNCAFIGNSAGWAAAVFNDEIEGAQDVVNCFFADNVAASRGGAMVNRESKVSMERCIFTNNSAAVDGGAIWNRHEVPKLTNCIISGNSAGRNGGGICNRELNVWLINCTIVGNEAVVKGGGVYGLYGNAHHLINCVLWDNRAYHGPQMAIYHGVNLIVRHSSFQGGLLDIHSEQSNTVNWADGNNTDANPSFADSGHWNAGTWVEGDYHLRWDSHCIDAGDLDGDYAGLADMDGEPRVMGGRVDMGADEVGEKRADFTRDGIIDLKDFSVFSQFWPENSPDNEWYLLCNLYEDGQIDALDVMQFVEDWLWQADWYEQ